MGLAHPESETSFSLFWIRRTTTHTLPRQNYGLLTEPGLRRVVGCYRIYYLLSDWHSP
jgi:hypothetical protein